MKMTCTAVSMQWCNWVMRCWFACKWDMGHRWRATSDRLDTERLLYTD